MNQSFCAANLHGRRCALIPKGFRIRFHGCVQAVTGDELHIDIDDMAYNEVIDFAGATLLWPAVNHPVGVRTATSQWAVRPPGVTFGTIRARIDRDLAAGMARVVNPPACSHSGVPIGRFSELVTYRLTRTPAEKQGALLARTQAYRCAGKFTGAGLMVDEFDDRSDCLAIFLGDHVIGSARIIKHEDDGPWEHDPFADWSSLPPKRDSVEISRVSILPERQQSGVLVGLIQRTILHTVRAGKRHLVSCTSDKLHGMYAALGCTFSGAKFSHPDLGGEPHTIIYKELVQSLTTCSPPAAWAIVWSDVYQLLLMEHAIGLGAPVDRAKRKVMTLARPLLFRAGRFAKPARSHI